MKNFIIFSITFILFATSSCVFYKKHKKRKHSHLPVIERKVEAKKDEKVLPPKPKPAPQKKSTTPKKSVEQIIQEQKEKSEKKYEKWKQEKEQKEKEEQDKKKESSHWWFGS